MLYSKLALSALFFITGISLNAQSYDFFKFTDTDYSDCAAILFNESVLIDDYHASSLYKCKLKESAEGKLSVSTVSLTPISATPVKELLFYVAIKNKKTNTLFLLTKEAVLNIDIETVLKECKIGDTIIILTKNKRFNLRHHEIDVIWEC